MKNLFNLYDYSFVFFNFIDGSLLVLIALVILMALIIIIYTQIKYRIFKKNASVIEVKVKDVKRKGNAYNVTFEFEYGGKSKEETIVSQKNFKINSTKSALYLEGKKSNLLSVEGQGFYVSKGAGYFGIVTTGYMLFLIVLVLLNVSEANRYKIIVFSAIIFLLLIFVGLHIFNKNKKITKNKNEVVFYNNVHLNENSNVDTHLVRYIPKYAKPKTDKIDKGSLLFRFIFIGIGGMSTIIGFIMLINVLKVITLFDNTIAEISDIYTYKASSGSGGNKIDFVGVIYTYEVSNNKYSLDIKTGISNGMYFKNVGDKEKIYYEGNNPSNSVPKSSLPSISVFPMVIGVLFLYIGIQNIIEENEKKRLYKMYVKLSEEN